MMESYISHEYLNGDSPPAQPVCEYRYNKVGNTHNKDIMT